MERQGFSRTIRADDGTVYHLPTAEYDFNGYITANDVLERAKSAAASVKSSYAAIVSEAVRRTWYGLPIISRKVA
jgi:hypothetical protein